MPEKLVESDLGSFPVKLEGGPGESYNEEAFHHLLAIERKRTERSNRPFLLLLLDLKKQVGADADIAPAVADQLFSGFARCLRETDFLGWYRKGRVLGAVLTHLEDQVVAEIANVVSERLRGELVASLPADLLERVQVRAYQRPHSLKGRS